MFSTFRRFTFCRRSGIKKAAMHGRSLFCSRCKAVFTWYGVTWQIQFVITLQHLTICISADNPNKYSIAQPSIRSNSPSKKFKISFLFRFFARLFCEKMKNVIDKNAASWYHIPTLKNS